MKLIYSLSQALFKPGINNWMIEEMIKNLWISEQLQAVEDRYEELGESY